MAGEVTLRKAIGGVLGFFILLLIGILAFSIRLFSVIKYESVIHEFGPYFNYRITQFLTRNGIYDFWNWFDDRTCYPLGRVIGGTVYPGLTLTAGSIWWLLNNLNIPLSVETVCVFTAPIFLANAAWATYLLTKEVKGTGAGLTAAALLAMVASWWDYGYQTTAMANRTVIVDNNTWNNTHIATVGTAMSSPEKPDWEIFNSLDVKYVLVVFGGLVGYPSDDINKFLWMVRIGGGVFPHIREPDYLVCGNRW